MISVILADHESVYRTGMASALAAEDDIRIVGQPATPAQLVRGVENLRPHVVVLSARFLTWLDAIRQVCTRQHAATLLLRDCGAPEPMSFSEDFEGIIDRSADERTIVQHVRHLARGGRAIRLNSVSCPAKDIGGFGIRIRQRITPAEMTIIAYVVQGYKNREIAIRMGTKELLIKSALRRIFDKTGVYGRLELALFVLHHRVLIAAPAATYAMARQAALFAPSQNWEAGGSPSVH